MVRVYAEKLRLAPQTPFVRLATKLRQGSLINRLFSLLFESVWSRSIALEGITKDSLYFSIFPVGFPSIWLLL